MNIDKPYNYIGNDPKLRAKAEELAGADKTKREIDDMHMHVHTEDGRNVDAVTGKTI